MSEARGATVLGRSPAPAERRAGEAAGEVTVRCHSLRTAFGALAQEWNRLHAVAAAASIFNSWIWQYDWWQVYGREQPLRILVASAGDETVGIFALYVQTVRILGLPVRLLRPVGIGGDTHPDDLGPLLLPGYEEAAARAIARAALEVPGIDVCLFSDIDPGSGFLAALEPAAARAGLAGVKGRSERIVFVRLPETWGALLASLDSKRRYRLRGLRNRLAAAKPTRFFVWDDPARIDFAIDRLVTLHHKRWDAAGGGSGSFRTPEYIGFHRTIIKDCLRRGWLRLYCLEIEGEISAIYYGYRFRRGVYLMQTGFDPQHEKWRPGTVLVGHALEHAIAEGNEVFDFLRGDYYFKNELASDERETRFAIVFARTLGARAFRAQRLHWGALESWLRARLRALLGRGDKAAEQRSRPAEAPDGRVPAGAGGFRLVDRSSHRALTR